MTENAQLGIVVIGRNEGERLRTCLRSVAGIGSVVYVDSGSTDGSRELAREMGVAVVELSADTPFTAARGRNTGVAKLLELGPEPTFVQMIDGDCELREGWTERALADLAADPEAAVVFGRRRERHAAANIYHRACDDEWNVPSGIVDSCGGDAMFRVEALEAVGGYDPTLIAGEEPDLCLRLRREGWRVRSNGAEMTWHDIAMSRYSQWWRRSQRAGFAFAQLVHRYGRQANGGWTHLVRSAVIWSALFLVAVISLPVAAIAPGPITAAAALLFLALFVAQWLRLGFRERGRMGGLGPALAWSWLILSGKLAQAQGIAQFHLRRRAGRHTRIIEYKG